MVTEEFLLDLGITCLTLSSSSLLSPGTEGEVGHRKERRGRVRLSTLDPHLYYPVLTVFLSYMPIDFYKRIPEEVKKRHITIEDKKHSSLHLIKNH